MNNRTPERNDVYELAYVISMLVGGLVIVGWLIFNAPTIVVLTLVVIGAVLVRRFWPMIDRSVARQVLVPRTDADQARRAAVLAEIRSMRDSRRNRNDPPPPPPSEPPYPRPY